MNASMSFVLCGVSSTYFCHIELKTSPALRLWLFFFDFAVATVACGTGVIGRSAVVCEIFGAAAALRFGAMISNASVELGEGS